jgi:hypothetical protein
MLAAQVRGLAKLPAPSIAPVPVASWTPNPNGAVGEMQERNSEHPAIPHSPRGDEWRRSQRSPIPKSAALHAGNIATRSEAHP